MRLSIMRLLVVGVAIASAPAAAQQSNSPPTQSDELASTYQAWQQARDTEEKIGFGERVLALESGVATWPLEIPRQRFTAEVSAAAANTRASAAFTNVPWASAAAAKPTIIPAIPAMRAQ